jgi:hypothetical protein
MTSLRIFVSSSGDIGEEHLLARYVIAWVQREFVGRAVVIFWGHEPLRATASFQDPPGRPPPRPPFLSRGPGSARAFRPTSSAPMGTAIPRARRSTLRPPWCGPGCSSASTSPGHPS